MQSFFAKTVIVGVSLFAWVSCGDGNNNPADPICGNAILETGEACDDGNNQNGDACNANCVIERCGDGVVNNNGTEACDDGNNQNGDGCDQNCQIEVPKPACGDGNLDDGEECDDGNNENGDKCDENCVIEPPLINLACPLLEELPKFCVPLPGSDARLALIDADANCGPEFFPEQGQNIEAFEIRKLFDDTVLIKDRSFNTIEKPVMVLFLGKEKALLYDTGDRTEQVLNIIAHFLDGRPVEVINTHLHGDHINNNGDFDVIAIDTDAANIRNHCGISDVDFDANQAAVCNNGANYIAPQSQVLFNNQSFRVVRVVRDGHQIDLGGRVITVLFTPGHSKTSTTLHDTGRRLLLTGDTLYPGDKIPLVHPNGSNITEYLETAERYAALEPEIDVVIGAHSQGVMPARVLSAFRDLVQNRVNGGNQNQVVDPEGCASGGFVMANFPAP